tara:strand:+ start:720 stop:1019 length:300 start_codon:yes stop_codon:yes gene_type:complete
MNPLIPWILLGGCFIALLVSLWYNYKFARIIMNVEDSVSESLDVLDQRYQRISKILEIPLFFDSPQVRQVVNDIQACRDTILMTANKIANLEEETDGKD